MTVWLLGISYRNYSSVSVIVRDTGITDYFRIYQLLGIKLML